MSPGMRRLELQRYAVVVPRHVGQLLDGLRPVAAETLRVRLYNAASAAVEGPERESAAVLRTIEAEGARLLYEHDPENQVLIALDVLSEL